MDVYFHFSWVNSQGRMVSKCMFNFIGNCQPALQSDFTSRRAMKEFQCFQILVNTCNCQSFSMLATLETGSWCFTVDLICISLMTNNSEHFSCAYWPFLYHLLWKACSNLLPIFSLDFCLFIVEVFISPNANLLWW